ncbi:MAG: hypothetical protein RL701_7916 [Pseudomonadota bacterium]|jgi:hypothetical protein
MTTMTRLGLALALGLGLACAAEAHADDKTCSLKYTRTACPGQEAESYKKCDGKQSCEKTDAAKSADDCKKAAAAACSNDRLTVTASKVVNASFEGKPLKSASGKDDFCADYAKRAAEYNHCSK